MNSNRNVLPLEIQSTIVKLIPCNDWHKILEVAILKAGLSDQRLWTLTNLDLFALKDEDIQLFQVYGHLIDSLEWHEKSWQSVVSIQEVFDSFSNVVHLDVSGNSVITSLDFLVCFKNLCHLNISSCNNIGRINLVTNVRSLQHLMYLDISDCTRFRVADIINFSKRLRLLKYFNVRDTVSLSVDSVRQVAHNLTNLTEFKFCPLVYRSYVHVWFPIHQEYPKLKICSAALEIIFENNPNLL